MLLLCNFASSAINENEVNVATIDLMKYGFIENGEKKGLYYEIANKIIIHAGYIPRNIIVPYPRAIHMIKMGTTDFSIMFTNAELVATAEQLIPIIWLENIVVGISGTELNTLSDLHGKIVATLRSASYDKRLDDDRNITKYPTIGYIESVKMLIKGRVDAIVGTRLNINMALRELNLTKDTLGSPLILNSKFAFLQFSKKANKSSIKDKIQKSALSLKEKGIFQKIINKYRSLEEY